MGRKRGKSSRRGLVLTAAILAAITVASFAVWLMPQNSGFMLVTTDYGALLDSTFSIHQTLIASFEEQAEMVAGGQISAEEYVSSIQVLSDQTTEQMTLLATSDPPAEWFESYRLYIESLRSFNSALRESIVLVGDMANGDVIDPRIGDLLGDSINYTALSESARP